MITQKRLKTCFFWCIFFFLLISQSKGQPGFVSKSLLSSRYGDEYVGGMVNYKPSFSFKMPKYDYKVNNKNEFLQALKSVKSYGTIYIEGDSEIDLSDQKTINVRTGVKIISNRGNKGSLGARLYSNNPRIYPMFECGSYVNFIGLRIDGTDENVFFKNVEKKTFKENTYGPGVTQGIRTHNDGLVVSNCEFSGWTHSAIMIKGKNAKITHSYFHHNMRHGLGYGITVDGGHAVIQGNLFDYNRHSIASTGVKNSSYIVEYNIFLENGTSHVVDVHGGRDRKDNTDIAGKSFVVQNNWFRLKEKSGGAFVIRGIPTNRAVFSNNTVEIFDKNTASARDVNSYVRQNNAKGNFVSKNNVLK